jgi:nucleoside-triphosphatase THEP1
MKVDPEKLEQEADELLKQMMEQNAEPAQTDTPPAPEYEENTPAELADTVEDGEEIVPQEEDRGDPDPDDGNDDLQKQVRLAEERIKNAQSRMTKATQEAADLRKEIMALRQQNAELGTQLVEVSVEKNVAKETLDNLREEYPDFAVPILDEIGDIRAELNQYRTQVDAEKSQNTLQEHFSTIEQSHPDMNDIVTSDDFAGWLERQSPVWQRVAQDGSAHEVVELLSKYKETFDTQPQQPVSKVDRARKVAEPTLPKARRPDPNSGKRIWTREEITRMPLDEFEKRSAEIDQAYMDGRVR